MYASCFYIYSLTLTDRYYGQDFEAEIINRVHELAEKKEATMAQVALKWVLNQKSVVAPIVGSTSPSQLEDLVGAFKVYLQRNYRQV